MFPCFGLPLLGGPEKLITFRFGLGPIQAMESVSWREEVLLVSPLLWCPPGPLALCSLCGRLRVGSQANWTQPWK